MVRAPCCDNAGVKRGPWTEDEDMVLVSYIQTNGHGNWRELPKKAGLNRCGKSCRLRWTNYLRPDIKRGNFTKEEEDTIIQLHTQLGNRWSVIAAQLPGRTDNEIKNVWHTYLKKRLPQGSAEPEAAVRRLPKETDLSRPEAPSSTTLVLNQQQQQHSETVLLWLPGAEDEPATSCSSSFSGYSDDLVDLSSFDVTDLDEAFWTEALAMNSALAEDQPGAEWAPYGGTTTATIGCSWLERITATQWSSGGAITGSSAGTSFDDATDFWLRLLAEAGNHQ